MSKTSSKFTGRHFLMVMLAAFGTIIAANMTLAYFAVGSFPGLDVPNTYVASQQFDAKRKAQETLGWQSRISYAEGVITLSLRNGDGVTVEPAELILRVGSATRSHEDQTLVPVIRGDGYMAETELTAGNKFVYVEAVATDGTLFSQRHTLLVD